MSRADSSAVTSEVLLERERWESALSVQNSTSRGKPQDDVAEPRTLKSPERGTGSQLARVVFHRIRAPSVIRYADLTPISLTELTPLTVHCGKSLSVRIVKYKDDAARHGLSRGSEKHVSCAYLFVIVQDDSETIDQSLATVELYNCFFRLPIAQCLPANSTLRIREPFFTLSSDNSSNDLVIRVDHPTDIEVILPETPDQSAEELKALGDAAFRAGQLQEAVAHFTTALEVISDQALAMDENADSHRLRLSVLLNRAATRLQQRHFDDCIQDCNEVLNLEYNFKAVYRRAKAYFELGFDVVPSREELSSFLHHCREHPADVSPAVQTFLSSLKQAFNTRHDWLRWLKREDASANLPIPSWEHSDTLVDALAGRGLGVIAQSEIKAGTLLVISPATVVRYSDDQENLESIRIDTVLNRCDVGVTNDLSAELADELCRNPSKRHQFYNLYAGPDYTRGLDKGDFTVDAFRCHGIQLHNSFEMESNELSLSCLPRQTSSGRQREGTGIWYFPSYFNHSCLPNCSRTFLSNLLLIKTARDVQPGEELTIGYINKFHSLQDRQECFNDFGFMCDCELCKLEQDQLRQFPQEVEIRQQTLAEYNDHVSDLTGKETDNQGLRESVVVVKRCIDRLRKSYERSGMTTMQYGLLRPLNALCTLHLTLNEWSEALKNAQALSELSPLSYGVDDLAVQADTLVAALQWKLSLVSDDTDSEATKVDESLQIAAKAWNVRALATGYAGYWHEFGLWWLDFLATQKIAEAAVRQRILTAFLAASE